MLHRWLALSLCVLVACGDNRDTDPCRIACPAAANPTCDGNTVVTYGEATCDAEGTAASCDYPQTRVDCTNDFKVCAAGACVAPNDPCATTTCTAAPAATCSGTVLNAYDPNGTCDSSSGSGVCSYTPRVIDCAITNQLCDNGACVAKCTGVTCTTPPADTCTGATSTTYAATGTCDASTGTPVCDYPATLTDCSATAQICDGATGLCADPCTGVTCTTPPSPQCSTTPPTTSLSFDSPGTCDGSTGSPVCSYPAVPTDCTATNQTCDPATGLCADPCALTSCTTPPAATCAANQLTTYDVPATCDATNGVATCSYTSSTVDCGAGVCAPLAAMCLADCGGSDCQTAPTGTCSADTLTTYTTPGTCDTSGAPTCQFATTTTDCELTGQTCAGSACVGTPPNVRVQAPATITDVAGTVQTVTGRIFIGGVTDVTTGNDPLRANDRVQFGIGAGTDPTAYTYTDAAPNAAYAGDEPTYDEYTASFTVTGTAGTTQQYAYRLSFDAGAHWIYGDADAGGASDGFTTPGTLQIAAPYFSEYIEGTSNTKALEIYNPGSIAFSLATCAIRQFTNGATTSTLDLTLTGSIPAAHTFTICQSSITTVTCDATITSTSIWNGDDAVELLCGTTALDIIGVIGTDPGTAWGTDPTTTLDHTLLRHCDVFSGDTNGADAFDPATEWKSYTVNDISHLGARTCPLP